MQFAQKYGLKKKRELKTESFAAKFMDFYKFNIKIKSSKLELFKKLGS